MPASASGTAPGRFDPVAFINAGRTMSAMIVSGGVDGAAADISVTYALELAQHGAGVALGETEKSYIARTSVREGYQRAIATCQSRKAWFARTPVQ